MRSLFNFSVLLSACFVLGGCGKSPSTTDGSVDSSQNAPIPENIPATAEAAEAVEATMVDAGEPDLDAEPAAPSEGVAETDELTFHLAPQQGVMGSLVNYYAPMRIALSTEPAEELRAEPEYASDKPRYGAMRLGDGADTIVTLVVDEAEGQAPRIYVDCNNDEDLTNDGTGEWTRQSDSSLALSGVVVNVDYDTEATPYMFEFYRFKDRLQDFVLYYRNFARTGEVTSDGKSYKIAILDENADGRFDDLENGTLIIDLDRDGKLLGNSDSPEHHKLGEPFNIDGTAWEVASLSADGAMLKLQASDAPVAMKVYLEPGYPAPTFTGEDLDGNPMDLSKEAAGSEYVLLDFWASWCGPCRGEFPYLRKLHARYKDHGLRIIGISLDSDRAKAEQAAKENGLDYPHVFDGGGWKNAAAQLYRVHSIPATFLLDKELNIVAKDLRGSRLELQMTELLGPGDAEAAAAVEAAMSRPTAPHSDSPQTAGGAPDLSAQILPEADEAQLSDAAIVLYASPECLPYTKALAAMLEGDSKDLPLARVGTLQKALASDAQVVVLLTERIGAAERDPEIVELLKSKKVIGIGRGAAELFEMIGLEIGGNCANVAMRPAEITLQTSQLLGKPESEESIISFDPDRMDQEGVVFGMYIPEKSEQCSVVDVIARWAHDKNYAPIVRQGNHVLVGITPQATTWTADFAEWFHELAATICSREMQPFSTAKWETTEPGTYDFTLAPSGSTDELSGRTFYFQFREPVRLSFRLEHQRSNAMMLIFYGENGRHHTREDGGVGKPLAIACDITRKDIQDIGDRYWKIGVTNFDRANDAECKLVITCE